MVNININDTQIDLTSEAILKCYVLVYLSVNFFCHLIKRASDTEMGQ